MKIWKKFEKNPPRAQKSASFTLSHPIWLWKGLITHQWLSVLKKTEILEKSEKIGEIFYNLKHFFEFLKKCT